MVEYSPFSMFQIFRVFIVSGKCIYKYKCTTFYIIYVYATETYVWRFRVKWFLLCSMHFMNKKEETNYMLQF